MDLKQLRTFVEVAETGSLSRASDKMRVAQSALSRHIRLMEAELGFSLFIRHGRGMQLTDAGRDLSQTMTGLLQQLEQAIEDARSHGDQVRGDVALGLMPTTSVVLASRLALRVRRKLPEVRLRIVEGYAGHLVEWLQRGQIDLTLLYGPGTDYHLKTTELLYEELMLIGPSGSHISNAGPISMAELCELPLVLPSRPHGLRVVVDNAAEKRDLNLKVAFEADSYRVLLELVAAGLGYAVLPLSCLEAELESKGLSHTRIDGSPIRREIVLACQPARSQARALGAVSDLILEEIARLVAEGIWAAYPAEPLRHYIRKRT
ncbi:LysR family transcriptional regulator [Paracoccus sp. Z118]|uniref:LysR substrate-binding domain-containing protein n=1 Tax=Paracoccus sp. Z118 TaxID=2851017 RepID=UPI001C2C8DF6|nr:LysR substrate-binding domain-containing protein [Paracoccus sp. Z118]MBV0893300.1 LysR family transcriptional regulator [Paracoccus sp. Z118]